MIKKIIGACLENCVHVAGTINFLRLAEQEGYKTVFLGPAVPLKNLLETINAEKPDIVGLSYRLTPEVLDSILIQLNIYISNNKKYQDIQWLFGGTELTAHTANKYSFFSKVFTGRESVDETISYIRGKKYSALTHSYPQTLIERIQGKYPYPVLRHHFGLPSLNHTIKEIEQIAEAKILDIISIAPDQNAQQFFFKPEKIDKSLDGAGGIPLRTREDFTALYNASRTGNFPLLRCYSGTKDIMDMGQLLLETLKNAWCAVPLCWYNVLDGRSSRPVSEAVRENQQLMKWHGEKGIPVEVNEAHHWSLRDAHDAIGVAAAYLAAYNAKKMGVKHYIAQYMFNVPPSISPKMDIAKMLAKIEMIEGLQDSSFTVYRQARAGLASLPADLNMAKGQLASSTYTAMFIKPHILHVVGYCEAHHAATSADIIESCKIVRGVLDNCMAGLPEISSHASIIERKEELIDEAYTIINAIKELYSQSRDPLTDPIAITNSIKDGLLDAPHLKGNKSAFGELNTAVINGACYAYDFKCKKILTENERIREIVNRVNSHQGHKHSI